MGSIRQRKDNGMLMFDFRYQGVRCREQTTLQDTKENRQKMERVLKRIEAEITDNTDSATDAENRSEERRCHKVIDHGNIDHYNVLKIL